MRVLLVEDNPMNVELFTEALATDGHEVVVERDGMVGRARALAERYDAIVLDIQLPGMRGDAICRELRDAGVRSTILALSAAAMPEQINAAMRAGFDAYLTKPISPHALRDAVRRHAEEKGE